MTQPTYTVGVVELGGSDVFVMAIDQYDARAELIAEATRHVLAKGRDGLYGMSPVDYIDDCANYATGELGEVLYR